MGGILVKGFVAGHRRINLPGATCVCGIDLGDLSDPAQTIAPPATLSLGRIRRLVYASFSHG